MKGMKILLLLFVLSGLVGCKPTQLPEVEVTHTINTILKDTIYETEVHTFTTNVSGPRVAIVGGIHGDEIAGWNAGMQLLDYDFQKGSYLIIPRANILATQLILRYPGQPTQGWYQEIKYSDLNRIFPGRSDGNPTEVIADAIISQIVAFDPEYIIDLHESRDSYEGGYLGDSVIYNNVKTSLFALELVEEMNAHHLSGGDTMFRVDNSAPEGSFNNYCSAHFDAFVMTFETNRKLDLTKRVGQQLALLQILFNRI